ncbi:MAG: hypothetical protein AB7G44_14815 [Bacteroidia bacterium]
MENKVVVETKKAKILPELYKWAETFNPENILYNKNTIDEDDEEELYNSYEYVFNLAERLDNNKCSEKDYEDILFHIEQINYTKVKIRL